MKMTKKTLYSLSILGMAALLVIVVNNTGGTKIKDLILATHDSFVMNAAQIKDFNTKTGYSLKIVKLSDAGGLTNKLVLTKDSPIADAVFGIDNSFAGVATKAGIIDGKLVATDYGDVCFNYDRTWFESHKLAAPTSVRELTKPLYKGLTVIENPNISSTGLAFLAASVEIFGSQEWPTFWKNLKANDVKVDDGWETAYYTDFSGSSGKGAYPIVLSYATSPADEVRADGKSQTAAITDGCFRQTEYVGVLKQAKNPQGAQKLIEYLLSPAFQRTFPTSMYMYPAVIGVEIPESWATFAGKVERTYGDTLDINSNRKSWLATWSEIFG
ncbi:MAG: thiamine ABC transporter substrate-binding protein [Candidatus Nanopelagicaceae bacterium]|nr:thiamine ABC transporter substrate-binding protein [Candidatus Nanopelagicaceae bacterium]